VGKKLEQVMRQRQKIMPPAPQRWERDFDHVESVEEIFAEPADRDLGFQVVVAAMIRTSAVRGVGSPTRSYALS
jgi:hypothetical protein